LVLSFSINDCFQFWLDNLHTAPSSEEEIIIHADEDTRRPILNIVNAVWDDGLYITFGLLPAVITVGS
jgi:hypothetical protein